MTRPHPEADAVPQKPSFAINVPDGPRKGQKKPGSGLGIRSPRIRALQWIDFVSPYGTISGLSGCWSSVRKSPVGPATVEGCGRNRYRTLNPAETAA